MFNYGDRVRINCTYFNDDVNGKKEFVLGKIQNLFQYLIY